MTDRGTFKPDDISDWFWEVIEKADRNREILHRMLQQMSRNELIRFDNEFQEAAIQLNDEPFTRFMEEGTSEDDAQDVADWVVSQGKAYFSEIWLHPNRIPHNVSHSTQSTLSDVAANVFWDRYNQSIPIEPEQNGD